MTPAAAHAVDTQALIVGAFTAATLVWTAVFVATRVRARRLRRLESASQVEAKQVAEPVEDSAAAIRARTVYVVTSPPAPAFDMDATAVLLRPYRGGRHAAH